MSSLPRFREVECKTVDGTTISAWLYEVDGPAPAIIMSHGFNCVKEMTLPEVAEGFQARGYNVLLYDARSVGSSEGQPRNLINPLQMAEDLSDIYTYVSRLRSVDKDSIVLWGMSLGAAVSATCAAVDRRAKAVVMVCPLFSYVKADSDKVDRAFAQLMRDRLSQLRGNEASSLQPFTAQGDNAIGMGGAGGPGGLEAYNLMRAAVEKGAVGFRDRIALQTYHKMALFRPSEYLDMVRAPVLLVIPELDDISPPEEQLAAYDRIQAPKKMVWAKGKAHLNVVTGSGSVQLLDVTAGFIRAQLGA
ncbi:Alpha/Beta hydrolase protein [Chaetomium sp. MPI-CAGE-AT-0009]|nr:Alpha/Beta hydrolase protein [Chaetomium sp. MPI-CAGE-AT-0009]